MRSRILHPGLISALVAGFLLESTAHAGNGNWTSGGPYGKSIKDILAHPVKTSVLYAGAFGLGVFKSTDGGISWAEHRSGFRNSFVHCLAMDTARPETLYAGTNDGLYSSYDGDSTWILRFDAAALAQPTSVRAVAVDRLNPGSIYVGTFDDGIFKSLDYGAHWTAINLGLTNTSIRCVTIHPTVSDTVLAGTGGGVFTSTDGGLSWTQDPDTAVSTSAAEKIVFDPLRSTRIYVATGSHGVVFSQNAGASWTRLARGLTSFLTRSLAVIDTVRYVGTDSSGVFYSTASETLWHEASAGLTNRQVDALLARSKTEVWAGTDGGGLFHTTTSGGSWSQASGGLLLTDVFSLGVSPASNYIYSGTGNGDQFWRSIDQGATWIRTSGLSGVHSSIYGIANGAGSLSTVYAAINDVGVFKSLDNGDTWFDPDSLEGTLKQRLLTLTSHPVFPGVLYAGAYGGVYKTTTGGSPWAPASAGLPLNAHIKTLGLCPTKPDSLFAGTDSLGLYVSVNGASTWNHVGTGIQGVLIREVVCDPATAGVVYAATDSGLFRSTDLGGTWTPKVTGLPAVPSVRAIAYDALHPNVWFAGVWQAGVYWSGDAGDHWQPLLGEPGSINVVALTVDAAHTTVYAGTQAGTWQFTNYPLTAVAVSPGGPVAVSPRSWPNPFQSAVVMRFANRSLGSVSLAIFDAAGRRVRELLSRARLPAGPAVFEWDGRDDRGSRVSGGVYFAKWRDAVGSETQRLVMVR